MDFINDMKKHLRSKLGLPQPVEEEPILLTDEVNIKTFHPTILDMEHKENVDFYLAGQPNHSEEAEIVVFGQPEVDAMRKQAAKECLPVINSFLERLNDNRDIEADAAKVAAAKEMQHLSVEEIERRAKAIVANRVINANYDNGFDINECTAIGCHLAKNGCCMAYRDPTLLVWHRHDKPCPTGPRVFTPMSAKAKLNPLKASKRRNR